MGRQRGRMPLVEVSIQRIMWVQGNHTEVEERDQDTRNNSSLLEQVGREESPRCEFLADLPEWEDKQEDSSKNKHGNHARIVPFPARPRC